jgi:hypothetical protein
LKEIRAAVEAEREQPDISQFPSVVLNIYSVPKGAQITAGGFIQYADGTPAETEFRPYDPTPNLPVLTDQRVEPLPVVEFVDDNKIAVLHPHRRHDEPGVA